MGSFDQDTLGAVKRILFAIAENDVTSVSVLANKFDINRLTIANILIPGKGGAFGENPPHGSNDYCQQTEQIPVHESSDPNVVFYFTGNENTI